MVKIYVLIALFSLFVNRGRAQDTVAVFKNSSIRLESNSRGKVDTSLIVKIKDPNFRGKIIIKPKSAFPSAYLNRINVPIDNSFEISSITPDTISYLLSLPRDKRDDRQLSFVLEIIDDKGKKVSLKGDSICTIYIKPFETDSLESGKDFEFWVFTGTNFDPFDGIRAQEFFFRINTLFRISKNKKWLGQIGIYKNRYFSSDSITNNIYYKRNNPFIIDNNGVSSYSYSELRYKRTIKRTVDPVGLTIDILHHINSYDTLSKSRFYVSGGMDINSRQIIHQTVDSDRTIDTVFLTTPQPDSAPISAILPESLDSKVNYQIPNYNLNVGFMWIFDNNIANIKTQLIAGLSSNQEVRLILARGTNQFLPNYGDQTYDPYAQFKMFATAKKSGISLGFELFIRRHQFPQFGFTLSKVFDLRNFLDVLTPVESLKLNK